MKTTTYLLACSFAVLTAAGSYYAYQLDRKLTVNIIEAEAEHNATQSPSEATLNMPSKEKIDAVQNQNMARSVNLERKIATMRAHQLKRDEHIKAYREITRLPLHLPDLPVIEPLQYPTITSARNQTPKGFGVGETYTLPQDVMTKFTNETGLSQDEINQAMNR